MDIYEYEMDFCKAADICRIITRITGRELYHGDTQYNYDEVFVQMERDVALIEEIINVGSFPGDYEACAAGSGMNAATAETRWDFAVSIIENTFFLMTE